MPKCQHKKVLPFFKFRFGPKPTRSTKPDGYRCTNCGKQVKTKPAP